ncbi:hypothetical protein [Vibrio methylphosphonaticus]|uniref:hypothetical protein n=1 Tax=Vibrio methylphosphonaticus TaxID=2946866 RepID=UPI00202A414C|nr:hypothetical protein [Vibrio methylphosphonaticus]MCL9777248.1 hypothetical protein [Vibrio methylphosphonaticus]
MDKGTLSVMKILFLHTLASNIALFKPLAAERFPQHDLHHDLQEDFLTDIRKYGQNTMSTQAIHDYLNTQINMGMDYIVCTCSTLGPVVDSFPSECVFRVDKPMAQLCKHYQTMLVLVTLESTIEPTRQLLESQSNSTNFVFQLIEGAWEHYASGDVDAFNQCIVDGVGVSLRQDHSFQAIVLAQASMMSAAPLISKDLQLSNVIPVLTSPEICLSYLAEHLN